MDWNTIIAEAKIVEHNITAEKNRKAQLYVEHVDHVANYLADDMKTALGFAVEEGKLWAEGSTEHKYTDIRTEADKDVAKALTKLLPFQVDFKITRIEPSSVHWYVQIDPERQPEVEYEW